MLGLIVTYEKSQGKAFFCFFKFNFRVFEDLLKITAKIINWEKLQKNSSFTFSETRAKDSKVNVYIPCSECLQSVPVVKRLPPTLSLSAKLISSPTLLQKFLDSHNVLGPELPTPR
jgi:hypothetical protein